MKELAILINMALALFCGMGVVVSTFFPMTPPAGIDEVTFKAGLPVVRMVYLILTTLFTFNVGVISSL